MKMIRYTGIETIDEKIRKKIEATRIKEHFVPRELYECNSLIPDLKQTVANYKDALEPLKEFKLAALKVVAADVAKDVAQKVSDDILEEAAEINEAPLLVAIESAKDVVEIIKDVFKDVREDLKYEKALEIDPSEKLSKIYNLGLYPKGFKKVDGTEKFVVDFPLKTYELGCWAEGDSEILYIHGRDEDCNKLRPLKPSDIPRIIE